MSEYPLYSPEYRQKTLDTIVEALRKDERIVATILVGSGAYGFIDDYSDIDLKVVIANENEVKQTFSDWKEKFKTLLPVISSFEVHYSKNEHLYGFLLEGFLEFDTSFSSLDSLYSRKSYWKIQFDRSGQCEEKMRSSWEKRSQPDIKSAYLTRMNEIWYYITHGVVALKRGKMWEALHYLETIRNQTVDLAGLRIGLRTKRFGQVDLMPKDFLAQIETTLVSNLDATEIMRVLKVAIACFFNEAKFLDKMLGLDIATKLEAKMREYLDLNRFQ